MSVPAIEWAERSRVAMPGVVPPPRPMAIPAFLYHFIRNPLRCLPQSVYEEPLVHYRKGWLKVAWITDPALLEAILLDHHGAFPKPPLEQRVFADPLGQGILTAQGADWQWQRRATAPLFRHEEILGYVPDMAAAAESQLEAWRKAGTSGPRRIDRDVTAMTYDAISRTLFGGLAMPEAHDIQHGVDIYLNAVSWEIIAALIRLPERAWHPGKPKLRRAGRLMRGAVERLLERWQATGTGAQSALFNRLLTANRPDGAVGMDHTGLVNNLLTFLNAGHETTAKAIMWTLYLLARAPEWQEQIREEVRRVAGDASIGRAHVPSLAVTRQVLEESMRLYAPAPVLTRLAKEELRIGGHRIEADTLVFIPIWAVHRHKTLWSDPDTFDPTRFAPERRKSMVRTQYMPFGFGPRICIGASFSVIEGVVMLATLLRGAHIGWNGREVPEPLSRVTLWPRGGMTLDVTMIDGSRLPATMAHSAALAGHGREQHPRIAVST